MPSLMPHQSILALTLGFWQSRALAVAVDLDIATLLSNGPLSVEELAIRSNCHAGNLYRLLRALETIGIFKQIADRLFANTETSACLLPVAPGSLHSWVSSQLCVKGGFYEAWAELGTTVKTGNVAFTEVHKLSFWEYCQQHPEAGTLFDDSMLQITESITPAVSVGYDFSGSERVVDVGGGTGTQLIDILERNSHLTGVLYDLPHVIQKAALHPRMSKRSGDFFDEVPAEGDIYLLRSVLHDWDDKRAIQLLRVIRKAFMPNARLLVVESLVTSEPTAIVTKWSDLLMAVFNGGQERTQKEFEAVFQEAGFRLVQAIPTGAGLSILVAESL